MIALYHYVCVAFLMIAIAFMGLIFNRHNTLGVLMCLELILLGINTLLVAFSWALGDPSGHVWVFVILAVAAAESALGLAILVMMWRNHNTIDLMKLMDVGESQ